MSRTQRRVRDESATSDSCESPLRLPGLYRRDDVPREFGTRGEFRFVRVATARDGGPLYATYRDGEDT